jgi:hypothetical protein
MRIGGMRQDKEERQVKTESRGQTGLYTGPRGLKGIYRIKRTDGIMQGQENS